MDILGYYRDDPIKVRIRSIFFTRRSVDQQTLMDCSGFSRSTVSRFLGQDLKREYIRALPREYRKPRIYYLESISLTILSNILKTDNIIHSCIPRFQEMLSSLQSEHQSERDSRETAFLITKIQEMIEQIEVFTDSGRFMRQAYHDLSKILEKDNH